MTAWRIVTRALYTIGEPATAARVELEINGSVCATQALDHAAEHGLVIRPGRGRTADGWRDWHLSPRGIDWCEGRVEAKQGSKHSGIPGEGCFRWRPTWLASLPRGVRITPPQNLMESAACPPGS